MRTILVFLISFTAVSQGVVRFGVIDDFERAVERTLPVYPPASLAAGVAGVAVAEVRTDTTGKVVWTNVLEAPDDAMSSAVREAVLQWKIGPVTVFGRENEARAAEAKIVFYFVVENGRGVVRSPVEMPGGPKRRPRPSAPPGTPPSGPPPAPPVMVNAGAGGHGDEIPEISAADLAARLATERIVVVDTRVRDAFRYGHRDGAVNIPRDELQTRGGIELGGHQLVVVDCTNDDMRWCRISGEMLTRAGIPNVQLLVK
jgi:hypothetical protein